LDQVVLVVEVTEVKQMKAQTQEQLTLVVEVEENPMVQELVVLVVKESL